MKFTKSGLSSRMLAIGALFSMFVAGAKGDTCSAWAKCPLDGAQANRVDTEYVGSKLLVYMSTSLLLIKPTTFAPHVTEE